MDLLCPRANNCERRNGERIWKSTALLTSAYLIISAATPLRAQEHVVSATDLHRAVVNIQQETRQDRKILLETLSTPGARKALDQAGIRYERVKQAVAALDDDTARRLAERATKANNDFAAGALNNEMLTYIVIALATAVIVILAVD